MYLRSFLLLICTASCVIGIARQVNQNFSSSVALSSTVSESKPQSSAKQMHDSIQNVSDRARSITVKVLSEESWGSGILIQRQGEVYTVLTNQHVLDTGTKYRIQTHDGIVYSASPETAIGFQGNDLALIQFRSPNKTYSIATLAQKLKLAVGDEVFAAGFPFDTDKAQTTGFKFTKGQLSLLIDKSLDGGYQIGYTNAVEKGMSGGPVLNSNGEVIAINGMHPYPIWGDPYVYKDGSKPCVPMHELMVRSSWAIPSETFLQLMPKSYTIDRSESELSLIKQSSSNSQNLPENYRETWLLRLKAEAAKNCQQLNSK